MKALIQNVTLNKLINELKTRVELDYKTHTGGFDWNILLLLFVL